MASDQEISQLSDIKNNLISGFDEEYLPTNLTVLKRLLYETQNNKLVLNQATKAVISEIIPIWEKSSLTIKRSDHCKEKLSSLYNWYAKIRKFHGKQFPKVTEFLEEMNNVFDISKDNIILLLGLMGSAGIQLFLSKPVDYIKKKKSDIEAGIGSDEDMLTPEDIESLHQLSLPEGVKPDNEPDICDASKSIDPEKELSQKFSQSASLGEAESEDIEMISEAVDITPRIEIMTRAKAQSLLEVQHSSSEGIPGSSQSSQTVYNVGGRNYENQNKRGTFNVMTPNVVAAFDKANVSDRDAVYIIGLIANEMNIGIESLILNRTSINAARAQIRKQECEKMRKIIQGTPVSFLIVHWDGKLIPDNNKKIDGLPILVSSDKFIKLINVPALQDQKAKTIASKVYASLKDWGLLEITIALCCDTTNANLGFKSGAAILLEQLMDKDLLYLACRRHILELILRGGYEQKLPGTSGPDVPLFEKFRDQWPNFDVSFFEDGLVGLELSLQDEVPNVIRKIDNFLQEPRNDYKELLQLSLIFLGAEQGIKFKKPGAVHHARWMAKALYSLKMYIFKKQFKMNKKDEEKLHAVCKFIVFVYINSWYTAPLAICAPRNDLNLKSLIDFQKIDKSISDATLKKLRNHLWYLQPQLAVLSLSDEHVDFVTKRKIVLSLENDLMDDEEESVKKFDPSDEGIRALHNKTLDYFTNKRSLNFFDRFKLDKSFLKIDCSLWEKNATYVASRDTLKLLTVVNDCAERAVQLTEEYIHTRSRDGERKQYSLQFVEESRKTLLNNSNKSQSMKKLKTT